MYAPACHVHLLPDYIENFDAAVAGGGGKAPSIIVQLHVMHGVSVPSIKTCYGLRHALDCSLPGAGSSGGKLNLAKFLHLEFFCLRASSGDQCNFRRSFSKQWNDLLKLFLYQNSSVRVLSSRSRSVQKCRDSARLSVCHQPHDAFQDCCRDLGKADAADWNECKVQSPSHDSSKSTPCAMVPWMQRGPKLAEQHHALHRPRSLPSILTLASSQSFKISVHPRVETSATCRSLGRMRLLHPVAKAATVTAAAAVSALFHLSGLVACARWTHIQIGKLLHCRNLW